MVVNCEWCDNPIHEGSPYIKITLSRVEDELRTEKELAYYHVNCGSKAMKSRVDAPSDGQSAKVCEAEGVSDIFDDLHKANDEAHRRTMASSRMGTIMRYYKAVWQPKERNWKVMEAW